MVQSCWRPLALSFFVLVAAFAAEASTAPDFEFLRVPKSAADAARPASKYRFMYGVPARWSGPIRWRYNHANAPSPFDSDAAGTLSKVSAALESWTQVCGVSFVYEGETTIAPNTRVTHPQFGEQPDDVNVVGWNTLEGNQAGVAWVWYDGDAGDPRLVDGDIILSVDRVRSDGEMRRTATHEWGHALGLNHSNVNGALMSGPPDSSYNSLSALQTDDIRGCRCLYGAAANHAAGFSCSLPERVALGAVPIGAASQPHPVTLTNHGNAPLTVSNVALTTLQITRNDGCAAGQMLAPGQSCTVTIVARPTIVFEHTEILTFNTSDGPYAVPVTFAGTGASVNAPDVVKLVEYFHAGFGHYFVTHLNDEIAKLDNGTFPGWSRTGRQINAWVAAGPSTSPVCRFFSERFAPRSSHFYTSFASECSGVKNDANWSFEGEVFHVALPDAAGNCAAGTQRVYRLYNDGRSGAPNHRFTTSSALRQEMIASGWVPEGAGEGVTMCAPI
jgi:hypothetical protein